MEKYNSCYPLFIACLVDVKSQPTEILKILSDYPYRWHKNQVLELSQPEISEYHFNILADMVTFPINISSKLGEILQKLSHI